MVKVTSAGITLQEFNEFITNKDSLKSLQDGQKTFKMDIEQQLKSLQGDKNPLSIKARQYLRWILKLSDKGFYILLFQEAICLIKKNLKVFFVIGLHRPNLAIEELFENEFCLELHSITSLKKGEGYKIMKRILEFTKRINLPLNLWTETETNVQYFERYGFKNYGQLGDEQEYLMIYQDKAL